MVISPDIPDDALTGRTEVHLSPFGGDLRLHGEAVEPYERLIAAAGAVGIELAIASGFRSFDRQLAIWNAKASGERPVLDASGCPVAADALTDRELVLAILRWSALPGASRHHWGTDVDVWDSGAVSEDYRLKLTPAEYSESGPFRRLGQWLRRPEMAALGFARPYTGEEGGVAPEPWHISYLPVASRFEERLNIDLIAGVIASADILLKEAILANFEEIYGRFIRSGKAP